MSHLPHFQLLIGEAWHEVLIAAVYATRSMMPLYFFCSYIVLVLLIFGNVFTGVICDRFQSMESEEGLRLHRMHRERNQIENSAARTMQRFYYRKFSVLYVRSGTFRNRVVPNAFCRVYRFAKRLALKRRKPPAYVASAARRASITE